LTCPLPYYSALYLGGSICIIILFPLLREFAYCFSSYQSVFFLFHRSPCNNWLKINTNGSYLNIGDLDIAGNQVTIEAVFNRTAPLNNGLYYGSLVFQNTLLLLM